MRMARRRKSDEEAEAIGYLIAGIIMLAGIAIVVAGSVAILAVAAVVGAVYGFGIATEQFLSLINPTFHVRVQKGRISWETGRRSSLHFRFLRYDVA